MAYYVYIGAGTDARLPVVAVIYGGSLVGGATNLLNMTALVAANNIVAVTMNYR
jgi:carboxylesterase type B